MSKLIWNLITTLWALCISVAAMHGYFFADTPISGAEFWAMMCYASLVMTYQKVDDLHKSARL